MYCIVYRIYTETNANLPTLAAKYLDGFSIFKCQGYWRPQDITTDTEPAITVPAQHEHCAVIEAIDTQALGVSPKQFRVNIFALARDIQITNNQQSVIVTEHDVNMTELTSQASQPRTPQSDDIHMSKQNNTDYGIWSDYNMRTQPDDIHTSKWSERDLSHYYD